MLFREEQRFSKWITIPTALLMLVIVLPSIFLDSNDWTQNLAIKLLLSILPVGIALFMFALKLKTVITEDYIEMKYIPLIKRKWFWKDIQNPKIIDYGFVGGWGIRIWTGYGTVYNTRGKMGLNFKLQCDSKTSEYTIGTQKPEELRKAIKHKLNN